MGEKRITSIFVHEAFRVMGNDTVNDIVNDTVNDTVNENESGIDNVNSKNDNVKIVREK